MPDRAVLRLQAGRVLVEPLAAGQTLENIVNDMSVGVKLGDGASDIFLRRIAEQVELGLVGAQDRPVRADEMQPHGAVLEEVLELLPALAQLGLHGLALGDVLEAVDGPENAARFVQQRVDMDQDDTAAPVRTLDDDLQPVRRLSRAQHLRHRRLGVRERTAVQVVETMGAAIALVVLARTGAAAPQLCGSPIVAQDGPVGRADVHGHGQGIQDRLTDGGKVLKA